ncbi:hypothetical protein [Stutzerimonas balearica]|uniref:hypothetical protein n=1 Tax=Stutzerimonas balearica TaxID=74829 RepID=UPI002896FA48|nr:hypothetical protein [Stutzerimonas balearica]
MPRRPTKKPVHYVRAVYNQGVKPKKTFEQLVRQAMTKLGKMSETEVGMGTLGTAGVRHRETTTGEPLRISLGAGVPGEKMATMGLKVANAIDSDHSASAPTDRAFKLSDAFALIDEDDLLVVTEGAFRVRTVGVYLRQLFDKAGLSADTAAFELKKVTNQETKAILEAEGIKEMRLATTMYQATEQLENIDEQPSVKGRFKALVGTLRSAFAEDVDENKLHQLAEHWGEMQVNTVISAKGGSRAAEIVLDVMQSVGEDVLEEAEEGVEVVVWTKKGTPVRLNEVTPKKQIDLLRREGANELINTEVYAALLDYRAELIQKGQWKK